MFNFLSKFKVLLLLLFIFSAFQSKAILTTPSLVAPINASSFNVPNVLLDWGGSTGATDYEFRIDTIALLAASPIQISTASQFSTSNLRFGTIYYWQVRAIKTTAPIDSSNWSSVWSFTTVDVLNLISPTNGSNFIVPNELLDWSGLFGVTNYQIQLDTVNTFNSSVLVSNNTSTVSQFSTSNLYFGTTYYWRVRAMHSVDTTQWSNVWSFTTTNNVNLVSPSNGSNFIVPNELLDWSGVFGVTNYQVELDTVSTFNSSVLVSSNTSTSSQFSTSNLYFGTTYYWRVRAMHSVDSTQWSNVWSFTTTNNLFLVSPTNGSNFIVPNELLDWSSIFGVTNYQVQLDTVNTFNSSVLVSSNTSTSSQFSTSNLYFGTTYYWRIRAMHSVDTTQWSNVWSFTTTNNVNLVSPTNGSKFIVPKELLDWSGVFGVTNYQVELDTVNTFNSSVLVSNNTSTSSQFSTSNLYFGTTYYWRVRAMHSVDTTQWSNVWSFTTFENIALVSPASGAVSVSLNPLLDWLALLGINGYEYRYSVSPTFSTSTNLQVATSQATLISLSYGTEYFWQVRAFHANDTTSWSNAWSFTTLYQLTAAPLLISPANLAVNVPVVGTSLEWNSLAGAITYEYQIADNSSFSNATSGTTSLLNTPLSTLLNSTVYYWRVRGLNGSGNSPWSTVWSFTTFGQLPAAPLLISPVDLAVNIPVTGSSLEWNSVASAINYEYQIADNSSFSNATSGTTSLLNTTLSTLLNNTLYYWRVRAINGLGNSPWSTVWTFTTVNQLPAAPLLISPADLAVNIPVTGSSLEWNSVASAINYEYQIADNSSFSNATSGTTSLLNSTLSTLLNNTVYYWRVRAINGSGNSPWSTVWSFTTTTNVGLSETQNEGGYSLYPNPASSQITILNNNNSLQLLTYFVLDVMGRIVETGSFSGTTTTIDLNSYQEGVYYLLMDNNVKLKFVKNHF
jgi:protein involved in ribonucleotide reduction/spore maturation protein SpmB